MMQYLESLRQQLALPDPEAVLAAAINVRAFLSRGKLTLHPARVDCCLAATGR